MGALSAFYDYSDAHDPAGQLEACVRLIAKAPTLAALAYKTSRGACYAAGPRPAGGTPPA